MNTQMHFPTNLPKVYAIIFPRTIVRNFSLFEKKQLQHGTAHLKTNRNVWKRIELIFLFRICNAERWQQFAQVNFARTAATNSPIYFNTRTAETEIPPKNRGITQNRGVVEWRYLYTVFRICRTISTNFRSNYFPTVLVTLELF